MTERIHTDNSNAHNAESPSKESPEFLTTEALAKRWNMEIRRIRQWRWNKRGPNFLKMGHHFLYPIQDVLEFEQRRLQKPSA